MAETKFPHVRAMLQRQLAPGAFVLLVMSAVSFVPVFIDYLRGEPRVSNTLTAFVNSSQIFIVEDVVITPGVVTGLRANLVEDIDGNIMCASSHVNNWIGEKKQMWTLPAFAACNLTPIVPFRVCSRFNVESNSGRRREFGPFCSPLFYPEIYPHEQLQELDSQGPQP